MKTYFYLMLFMFTAFYFTSVNAMNRGAAAADAKTAQVKDRVTASGDLVLVDDSSALLRRDKLPTTMQRSEYDEKVVGKFYELLMAAQEGTLEPGEDPFAQQAQVTVHILRERILRDAGKE